jgi:UDP-2-acetamido-3-amino-2,3-dideoxy-glucuronate N-acetyltransferase
MLAMGCATSNDLRPLRTRGTRLLRLPSVRDPRGSLVWGQIGSHLPFEPKRLWCIQEVPPGQARGNHGHHTLEELLICVHGTCSVALDDGAEREQVVLDAPDLGLYIPPLIWAMQHQFTPGAVLLVLSSDVYRPDDYVRDYDEFLALAAPGR